ncbi:MAG: dTDP-4-dehydrorhamnose reductase [Paracoccaceae bacterium]
MKILIFGQSGQVARELARRVPQGTTITQLSRTDADLANPNACAAAIFASNADAVINAAAYTAVDKAEADEPSATVINAASPTAMAMACAAKTIPFLHISTDYVFDGSGTAPFTPDHPTVPLGAYGRSKLAGELGIRAAHPNPLILRTSWVFSSHGSNFLKTMLRLGHDRPTLNVVVDQIGGPTPASAIADALYTCAGSLLHGAKGGTHHFAGSPDISWADFARAIMAAANLPCQITDIPSTAYPTPAKRPLNSRLDCTSLARFGIHRPDWRAAIPEILHDLEPS